MGGDGRVYQEVDQGGLEVTREGSTRIKGAWWWSEEIKGKVEAKQEQFKALMESRTEEVEARKVQYRIAKKEAKIAVAEAKNNAYETLYKRLSAKGGENEVFKLARARERRTRAIGLSLIHI